MKRDLRHNYRAALPLKQAFSLHHVNNFSGEGLHHRLL
jgi:hypothetical protein